MSLRRTPFGQKKRAAYQAEAEQSRTFEELLNLHGLDFWHDFRTDRRSVAGFPDYVIFGIGWISFVELKARSPMTNRKGKVSTAQERYKASIEAGGGEWRTFCLPDEWDDVDKYLNARTHKGIWGYGLTPHVVYEDRSR